MVQGMAARGPEGGCYHLAARSFVRPQTPKSGAGVRKNTFSTSPIFSQAETAFQNVVSWTSRSTATFNYIENGGVFCWFPS